MLLTTVLLLSLAIPVRAANDFELSQNWEDSIFSGGTLDLFVWVGENADDYTYQWMADVGFGEGQWVALDESTGDYGYKGTKTQHLRFVTSIENECSIGSGWEDIPFCCAVTSKKTGVTKYSGNMFMRIHPADDLADYMKMRGVELYIPTVGTSKPTTVGGIYYISAVGGEKLTPMCGHKPVINDPLMSRSDMTSNVEVWITEGGQTTRIENGGAYMPHTLGRDVITVDFKLHYTLGIHDMGYFDTKTMKISVNEPALLAQATTKTESSLLKEQYGQSQRLITVPKGATVRVYQKSGSWYLASYNNTLGYIDAFNLNLLEGQPVIDHVEFSVDEPVIGKPWPTTGTVSTPGCDITYMEWEDLTEGRYLQPGEKFVEGHAYQLVAWITARDGYAFKLSGSQMATTAVLNGNRPCQTSCAYEQERGKVMDVRYDFARAQQGHTCSPSKVPTVSASCIREGHKEYYRCSCGKCYSDAAGKNAIDPATWGVLAKTAHKPGNWTGDSTHHFKECTVCREVIASTKAAHIGGTATCLEKAKCTVCARAYGSLDTEHRWGPKYDYKDATGHAWICADCKNHDTVKPHTPGPAATDTTAQTCTECGYILEPAKKHTHNLTLMPELAPTCIQPGLNAYYACDGCNDHFRDAAGTDKYASEEELIIPPQGHQIGNGWEMDLLTHWRTCVKCGEAMVETNMLHDLENGTCTTCGYTEGTSAQPTQPATPTAPTGEAPTQPPADVPAADEASGSGDTWIIVVLCVIIALSAVAIVILLLRRKKAEH